MPLVTAHLINKAYYRDEFKLFIVYGPLGIGKSAYALKVAKEVYDDWDTVKNHIVFHPEDFVARCLSMSEKGKRDKVLVWDDAGLWLFAMDFTNPFIKAILKYMNVARTNWGALILTTPTPTWVLYKMRTFPQTINIKITKMESGDTPGHTTPRRMRIARAYRSWVAPDFKKQGVRTIYEDHYDAMLPNDLFWDWYKPLRDSYAKQAAQLMQTELNKVSEKIAKKAEKIVEAIIET